MSNQYSRGQENFVYSEWHRLNLPSYCTMTSTWNEFCPGCRQTIFLVEEMALNTNPNPFALEAQKIDAEQRNIPLLLIKTDRRRGDIVGAIVRPVFLPDVDGPHGDLILTSEQLAWFLWERMRKPHHLECPALNSGVIQNV